MAPHSAAVDPVHAVLYKKTRFARFGMIRRSSHLGVAGLLVGGWLLPSTPALAVDGPRHVPDRGGLELLDGRFTRADRLVQWGEAPTRDRARALAPLTAEADALWVSWDPDTLVPSRMIVAGIEAPGVTASPSAALVFVRTFLASHVDLLAPGASPSSFVIVANDDSAGMRTVGMQQVHEGVPVIGGQLSFRFKHDQLIAIASEALPYVSSSSYRGTIDAAAAQTAARTWIAHDVPGTITSIDRPTGPSILPLVDTAGARYADVVAVQVHVEAPPSRWTVYVDAATAEPVAREQTLSFASATMTYNVPVRGPLGERQNRLAPWALVLDGNQSLLTDQLGLVDFATSPSVLQPTASGLFVGVNNVDAPDVIGEFFVDDGSVIVWDERNDELVDAQLSAFIHASVVKQLVRSIDPGLAWLEQQLPVNVNIDDQCNAFSDGNSINFYQSSAACENTARLADVVYHEFGHSVHVQSLIPGVGFFDRALSEGISDYLSATITGDSGIARGFFFNEVPLRELDPPNHTWSWPEDRGQVHGQGRIIGGALWDLRKLLIEKLGPQAGVAHANRIWYEATRRAVDIPSMYVEALVVDDDDGDLSNGTPNGCEINAAFGPHGLYTANHEGGHERVLPIDQQTPEGYPVQLLLSVPVFPGCPVFASPQLEYRPRGESGSTIVPMAATGGGFQAFAESADREVLQYRVHVDYDTGTQRSLPDNTIDPWYEHWVGPVVPLYCTSFDDGAPDWELGPIWGVGAPSGQSLFDPPAARSGSGNVLGMMLEGNNGLYLPFTLTQASSPIIETRGYTKVRLQYWRWLTVEDGHFDQASILADGSVVWSNHATADEHLATFHHIDGEWRFHDVDLSAQAADGEVRVAFNLVADAGLHFGGWTVDELCVVGVVECGNGIVEDGEECDDGNDVTGDGCSPDCRLEDDTDPSGGDSGPGSGPGSGSGGDGGTDGPSADDLGLIDRGCACSSSPTPVGRFSGLALLLLGTGRRRRHAHG
jgi:cysteine-rich repeat protein